MVLDHSENVDARGGTFSDVHRDQFQAHAIYHQNFHVNNVFISSSGQPLHQLLRDITNDLPSDSNTWSETKVLVPLDKSRTGCDRVARLIVEIVQALGPTDLYNSLKLELKSLQQTFALAGLAIRAYEYTPLGQNLVKIINQVAERCITVLQKLLEHINHYRWGLDSTRFGIFWRQICWSGDGVDKLAVLKRELSVCQLSLAECLKGLNL